MVAEFEKHEGTEGALRSKNKECDKLKADDVGGYIVRFGPSMRFFMATDPTLAKFLMTMKPEMVEKAGLSDMLFGDDPNGFIGGLVYEEGANWHRSRKIITEEFNQAGLKNWLKFFLVIGISCALVVPKQRHHWTLTLKLWTTQLELMYKSWPNLEILELCLK